jgi:hypothetical protein
VGQPGKGSRGSEKRMPRQLSFKLDVIQHYETNQRLVSMCVCGVVSVCMYVYMHVCV